MSLIKTVIQRTSYLTRHSLLSRLLSQRMEQVGPLQTRLREVLRGLEPAHLEIVNESHKHSAGSAESHFKVFIVSDKFQNLSLLQRHRLVNSMVATDGELPMHALSLSTKTIAQWTDGAAIQDTPNCRGGSGK